MAAVALHLFFPHLWRRKVKSRNYVGPRLSHQLIQVLQCCEHFCYRDDYEYPSLEVLEQGSRNIEPIATLVPRAQDGEIRKCKEQIHCFMILSIKFWCSLLLPVLCSFVNAFYSRFKCMCGISWIMMWFWTFIYNHPRTHTLYLGVLILCINNFRSPVFCSRDAATGKRRPTIHGDKRNRKWQKFPNMDLVISSKCNVATIPRCNSHTHDVWFYSNVWNRKIHGKFQWFESWLFQGNPSCPPQSYPAQE